MMASGSEVGLSVEAANLLVNEADNGINCVRIVSVPCFDLFEEQTVEYQKEVLGQGIPVMSVEAAATFGWSKYTQLQFGLDRFGQSAPIKDLKEHFGFNGPVVAEEAKRLVNFYKNRAVPDWSDVPAKRFVEAPSH